MDDLDGHDGWDDDVDGYDDEDDDEAPRGPGIWAWIGVAAVLIILFPFVVFGVAYVATDVPEPDELANNQISVIYDRNGDGDDHLIARIVPEEGNRNPVGIDEIPPHVRDAVLAAEDREFYTNPGFSLTGYARAFKGMITGDTSAGGGSTITQQYVKNAVVGTERSLTRKAKELVMSAKMARKWTKDEILEAYLNTIYFGRNAYGIQAAAEAYFDKGVGELTPAEGAVLAASIQRPSALDPWTNRAEAEARWNYVLDGMVTMGRLSQADRRSATYPDTLDPAEVKHPTSGTTGPQAMIKARVLEELADEGISETQVNTQGLRITTTIDPTVQQAALDAVDAYVDEEGGQRSAVVSIDPRNGAVRGYYGGDDPTGWDYANSGLQTGSTFKIFALAAALDQGIPLSKQYDSSSVTSGDATITNVGGESCGTCPISEALKMSLNTSFIRLQKDLEHKANDTAAMAHRLGVAESIPGIEKTLMEDNGDSYEGITLGQYLTRPFDMAVGLSTLAANGVYHKPHFVQKVETGDGTVLLDRGDSDEGERRVSEAVASNVIDAMRPIAAYSSQALAGGRESAAKTGTTQLGSTGNNKDAWMIGATPQLATAVWMGMVDGSALYNPSGGIMYGAQSPGSIWKYVMDASLANADWETFPDPLPVAGQAGRPNWGPAQSAASPDYYAGDAGATETSTSEQPSQQPSEQPTPTQDQPPAEPAEPVAPELPDIGEIIPGLGGN